MKREVMDTPIAAIGLPPADFHEQAHKAIATIPDEWESVVVGPEFYYEELENGNAWPTEYAGAKWMFMQGDKYAAFMVERPQDLLRDELREMMLRRVRDAFEKAGVA